MTWSNTPIACLFQRLFHVFSIFDLKTNNEITSKKVKHFPTHYIEQTKSIYGCVVYIYNLLTKIGKILKCFRRGI